MCVTFGTVGRFVAEQLARHMQGFSGEYGVRRLSVAEVMKADIRRKTGLSLEALPSVINRAAVWLVCVLRREEIV